MDENISPHVQPARVSSGLFDELSSRVRTFLSSAPPSSNGKENCSTMVTARAPLAAQIPQVQKLLAPLQNRERVCKEQIEELEAQLARRKEELADLQREISQLREWQPPAALLSMYAERRLKESTREGGVEFNQVEGEEEEEEEVFFDCEEDEQEEPAPPQPDDPLSASVANEDEHTFDVLNAAMTALRQEHDECVRKAEAGCKRKMSLLDRCFFDVRGYMGRLVSSLPPADGRKHVPAVLPHQHDDELFQPHLIAGGSTQMGKTMFVVVGYLAAWFAECPLVCLTTTVSGTKSLHIKVLTSMMRLDNHSPCAGISMHCSYSSAATDAQMLYFQEEIRGAERASTAKGKKAPVRIHRDVVARAALGGSTLAPDRGILFIADTAAQMRRAIKLITEVRAGKVGCGCFGLVIDEADSFQRTEDETLQLEQRLNDLKGIGHGFRNEACYDTLRYATYGGPAFQGANVIVSISATLLPVLLKMYKMQQENKALPGGDAPLYTFFTKAPPSKYVGVLSEVWQPFKRHGKPVFLRPDEVKGTNLGGILDGHYRDPEVQLRLDSNVLALYTDACAMPYSLLLDITVSRVNVEGASLRDKAQWLAEHFPNLTVVTVDGLLVRYKLPQQSWDASSWVDGMKRREQTIEGLLNELEPKMQGAPVAVFGYSQMIRGDSFRSDWRVPTHILQQLSNAMSVDRLVQSAGRASFIGKELLDVNATETAGGHAGHVRVLLTDGDYMTIRAYVEFMNMLADEIGKGRTVEELFDPSKLGGRKYLPHFSILIADTQRRCIGNRNENLHGMLDKRLFEADVEAEAAYAASCACDEAAKHLSLAEKRSAAARDLEKKLAVRSDNAKKCAESAVLAREAAARAEAEATTAASAAAERNVGGVRPSEKAKMDAAEAARHAAAAAKCAAAAMGEVTKAEVQAKVGKVEAAFTKAGESRNASKALEKAAEAAEEIARELELLAAEVEAAECWGEEAEEEEVSRWVLLDKGKRDELGRFCLRSARVVREMLVAGEGECGLRAAEAGGGGLNREGFADVDMPNLSLSCKKEGGAKVKREAGSRGKGGADKDKDKDAKKLEKELYDTVKSVRGNFDAARKLHQKASLSFATPTPVAADDAHARSLGQKAPPAQNSKARIQKLLGNAERMAAMAAHGRHLASEVRRLAGELVLRQCTAEEAHAALMQESEDMAAAGEALAGEVAVEAVATVTGEIEGKLRGVQELCQVLRAGEVGGEAGEDGVVAMVWVATVQGRKKGAKHAEALRALCTAVTADSKTLLGCGWAQGWGDDDGSGRGQASTLSTALLLVMEGYNAACGKVDGVVAAALEVVEEVLEWCGQAPPPTFAGAPTAVAS